MGVVARESWTDERLDDLNERTAGIDRRMGAGFAEVREEFRAVRGEIGGVRGEIDGVRGEIAALHRTLAQLLGGMMLTMLFGFGGMIVAIITQT